MANVERVGIIIIIKMQIALCRFFEVKKVGERSGRIKLLKS